MTLPVGSPEEAEGARPTPEQRAAKGSPVTFAIEYFNRVQRRPSLGEMAALELAVSLRDALHAETLASLRDDLELAKAANDGGNELLREARAALEHGEARERVMREALEALADRPAAMTAYGPKCTLCYVHGGGHDAACPVRVATDALATAQAMKEAAK